MIHEHTENFDLYCATSSNLVHALDYGNNETQCHLRVSCQSLEHISLKQAFENLKKKILEKQDSCT